MYSSIKYLITYIIISNSLFSIILYGSDEKISSIVHYAYTSPIVPVSCLLTGIGALYAGAKNNNIPLVISGTSGAAYGIHQLLIKMNNNKNHATIQSHTKTPHVETLESNIVGIHISGPLNVIIIQGNQSTIQISHSSIKRNIAHNILHIDATDELNQSVTITLPILRILTNNGGTITVNDLQQQSENLDITSTSGLITFTNVIVDQCTIKATAASYIKVTGTLSANKLYVTKNGSGEINIRYKKCNTIYTDTIRCNNTFSMTSGGLVIS